MEEPNIKKGKISFMKPSGLCSKCEFVNVCNVDSQTHAKVIQCVYRQDFEGKGITIKSGKIKST